MTTIGLRNIPHCRIGGLTKKTESNNARFSPDGRERLVDCWDLYGSKRPEWGSKNEVPETFRIVNDQTCTIASVHVGTITDTQKKRSSNQPASAKRNGYWLQKLSKVMSGTKRSFAKKFCGDPHITVNAGQNLGDTFTDDFMANMNRRETFLKQNVNNATKILDHLKDTKLPDFPNCNGSWKHVTAGHSLGGSSAQLHAYCNNYFHYNLMAHLATRVTGDHDLQTAWGEDNFSQIVQAMFITEVFSFGAAQPAEGKLINFAGLIPHLYGQASASEDFCWGGARFQFDADPVPKSFCNQPYEPMKEVKFTNSGTPGSEYPENGLFESTETDCSCPIEATIWQAVQTKTWFSAEKVLEMYEAAPCTTYDRWATNCLTCWSYKEDPGFPTHAHYGAWGCAIRNHMESDFDETADLSLCQTAATALNSRMQLFHWYYTARETCPVLGSDGTTSTCMIRTENSSVHTADFESNKAESCQERGGPHEPGSCPFPDSWDGNRCVPWNSLETSRCVPWNGHWGWSPFSIALATWWTYIGHPLSR